MKLIWVVTALLLTAALTSCSGTAPEPTQDVNAVYTSVAGTMVAQFNDQQTQTAQAVPPSPSASPTELATIISPPTIAVVPSQTPFLINTPSISVLPAATTGGLTFGETGVGCDNATYLSETEPARGTIFKPGINFSKAWTFQNSGTCTWINAYTFAFISGDKMGGRDQRLNTYVNFTPPGLKHTFVVDFQAPRGSGHYQGFWQMKNAGGTEFGARVVIDIVVK
jgi:hypothetical protein